MIMFSNRIRRQNFINTKAGFKTIELITPTRATRLREPSFRAIYSSVIKAKYLKTNPGIYMHLIVLTRWNIIPF